ncbi:hypothetical protein F4703DRAFT_1924007 [Phycomyces blakesleeanus]
MPIQGRPIGAPHLVLVLQNLLWGHLTYTTSGGSAQHRDEGRLSIKKRSWRNALKPSASYSESWTPPELSQGPEGQFTFTPEALHIFNFDGFKKPSEWLMLPTSCALLLNKI